MSVLPAMIVRNGDEAMLAIYLDRADVYTLLAEHVGRCRSLDRITCGDTCTVTFNKGCVSKVCELY